MKSARLLVTLAASAAAVVVTAASRDAHALGPIDLEVGAKAGIGTNPSSSSVNPLGFGLGGRGGVDFFGIYAGVDVMYYLGGSQTVLGESYSYHTLMYGVDLGYNFKIAILTIRPQVGIGNAQFTASGGGQSQTNGNLYLEPGLTGLVSLGTFFVGADANLLVLPNVNQGAGSTSSKTETAFTLHGQIGVRF
jgi:hypothetical protein